MKSLLFYTCLVMTATVMLVKIVSSEDSQEDCGENMYDECVENYSADGMHIPDNEKDLNDMCKQFIPYVECSNAVEVRCFGSVDKWKSDFAAAATEVCNKDSSLHQIVVQNIGCIQKQWRKNDFDGVHTCLVLETTVEKEIKDSLTESGEQFEDWVAYCPARYIKSACFIKSIQDCGTAATNAAIDTFDKFDFWEKKDEEGGCPPHRILDAVKKIEHMKLDDVEQELLDYALSLQ